MSDSFIKRLSGYLHDCVREEVKSSTFRNLKSDPDNKWFFVEGDESVFSNYDEPLMLDGSNPKLTELMIQGESESKDKYLLYGYLFLEGKNSKAKKNNDFLTPLLYAPCSLNRSDTKIELSLEDDFLSLNTGALASLIKSKDEEEVDAMLSALLDVVPELVTTESEQVPRDSALRATYGEVVPAHVVLPPRRVAETVHVDGMAHTLVLCHYSLAFHSPHQSRIATAGWSQYSWLVVMSSMSSDP